MQANPSHQCLVHLWSTVSNGRTRSDRQHPDEAWPRRLGGTETPVSHVANRFERETDAL